MKKKKLIIVTLFSLIVITSILTLIKVSASDALPYWGCAEKGDYRTWCKDYSDGNFLFADRLPGGPVFVRNDDTTDEKWLGPYRYPTIYQGRFGGGAETTDNTPFNVSGIGQIRAYAGQPFYHLIGYEPPVTMTDYPFFTSAARNVIETHRLNADTVKKRYGGNPDWVLPNLELYEITKKTKNTNNGGSFGEFYWIQDIAQMSGGYAENVNDASFDLINGTRLIIVRTSWPDIITFSSPTISKKVNSPITFNVKGYEYVSLSRNRVTWDLQVTKDGQTVATKTGTFYSTKGNKNPNKTNEYEAGYFDNSSIQWTPTEAGTYSATITINDQVRRYATKTTSFTVKPVGVEQLEITPSSASILKGTTQQYRAIYTSTSGVETDVTTDVTNTTWSSTDTNIATIGAKTGLATGVNVGTTIPLTVKYKTLQATAGIEVYNVPPTPPVPENLPPSVIINAPVEIKAGDPFCISADASDPDGTLETYSWNTPSLIGSVVDDSTCGVYYLDEGTYPVTVTVTDDEEATGEDTVYINVKPPTPVASMNVGGTLKENRKVNIDTLSSSPLYFPLDWTKSYFMIEPLDGQNINLVKSRATNVAVSGNQYKITNAKNIESLFKLKGRYQVTHYVENSKGLSDTTTQTVTINEDLKPNADFSTVTTIYRDNLSKTQAEATIRVTDSSYSPDDEIQQRIWTYKYNANNNGVFEESATTISSANETYITFPVNQVGRYLIELTVVEKFSQPTLSEFINSSDYRRDDTDDKLLANKVVEVKNLAPIASYDVMKKKSVDLQIYVGGSRFNDLNQIETKVNEILKPQLASKNIELNLSLKNHNFSASGGTGKVLYRDAFETAWKELSAPHNVNAPVPEGFIPIGVQSTGHPNYTYEFFIMNPKTGELLKRLAKDNKWVSDSQFVSVPVPSGSMSFGMVSGSWATAILNNGGSRQWRYLSETTWNSTGRANYPIPVGYLPFALISQTYADAVIVNPTTGHIQYSQGYFGLWEDYPSFSAPSYGMYSNVKAVPFPNGYVPLGIQDYGTDDNNMTYFPRSLYIMHNQPTPPKLSINSDSDYLFVSAFEDGTFSDYMKDNIKSQLIMNDGYFIGVGSILNTSHMQDVLTSNSGKGTLVDQMDLGMTVKSLSDYIMDQVNNKKVDLQVSLGNTTYTKEQVEAKFNEVLRPALASGKIGYNLSFTDFSSRILETISGGGSFSVGLKKDGTVVTAGNTNQYGELSVSAWRDIVQISTGDSQTVGLKKDGTVVVAGRQYSGISDISSWKDIIQVSASNLHAVGLRKDGTVIATGNNSYGQSDVSNWNDIIQVSTSDYYTVGLKKDGTVIAIGNNNYGQLNVSAWRDIVQISTSDNHIVGLKKDGTVVAAGYNNYSQLNVSSWTNIVQVSAGDYHTVGIKKDGTVVGVGSNSYGELNLSTWTNIVQVSASYYYTLGLKKDGTVVGIGGNYQGQIMLGSFKDIQDGKIYNYEAKNSKNPIFATIIEDDILEPSKIESITTGVSNSNADLIGLGTLNNKEQFNQVITDVGQGIFLNNSNLDTATQQMADYIIKEVTQKTKTIELQVALDDTPYTKEQFETGLNNYLKPTLNNEGINVKLLVKKLINKNSKIKTIATGILHSLVLLETGEVYSVGENRLGQLGDGSETNRQEFVKVQSSWGTNKVVAVSAGNNHSLILLESGEVYAFGNNSYGQLGDGTTTRKNTPVKVLAPWGSTKVIDISSGRDHSLFLLENGDLYGVGRNFNGQLGDGTYTDRTSPVKLLKPWGTTKISDMSTGDTHTLVLLETGEVYSVGFNSSGQLGNGTTNNTNTPVKVLSPWGSTKVIEVSNGIRHSLFLLETGEVYGVGSNTYGEIGMSTNESRLTPAKVQSTWGSTKAVGINAGHLHSHYILETGEVYASGYNYGGRLGSTLADLYQFTPIQVNTPWGTTKVISVSASSEHSLFLLETGEVYGVGSNTYGEIGDGTTNIRGIPTKAKSTWGTLKVKVPSVQDKIWSSSKGMLFGGYVSNSKVDTQYLTAELLMTNGTFIGVGNVNNQSQLELITQKNMERGTFIQDSSLEQTVVEMTDYIIQQVKKRANEHEIYLTLEESAEYFTHYEDAENDPKYADRWRYDQKPSIFENDMGFEPFNLINLDLPVKQFSKVGRFQTFYAARDNPIWWNDERFDNYRLWSNEADNWYIYVHRKPIPNYQFTINGTTGAYTILSTSFDLDKQSIDIGFGPGLQSSKWQWREKGQAVWKEGLPSSPLTRKEYEVKLTVKDFQNREESIVKILDATGVNKDPIADFEPIPERAYINDNINYKNYSYDPNGDALTYEWSWKLNTDSTWVNGTPTLTTESTREPTTKFSSKGLYDVRLRVRDSMGSYSTYIVKQVEIMNRPPKAVFSYSPATIYNNTNVSFTNSSSDPDNDVLTHKWEFMMPGSSTWTLFSSSQTPTTRTFTTKGDWRIRLTVSDGSQSADTEQILTVGNRAPVANFTYSPTINLYRGTSIALTDTSTDPDGSADIIRHFWEVQYASDTTWTSIGTTLNSSLTLTKVGNLRVRKTVEDSSGQVSSIIKTITISNRAPSVVISYVPSSNLNTETMIDFKATGNDPDTGDIPLLTYKWYFKGPNNADFIEYFYTDTEIQRRLSVVGSWQVKVVVTDPYGATGQDVKTINVVDANKPPTAAFVYSPSTIYRDTTVQFTNQSTDPELQTLTYQWFYQPPNSSTWTSFSTVTHPTRILNQLGTWKIRLVATDPKGASDDEIKNVVVMNRPPVAGFDTDKTEYNLGEEAIVTSTALEPDGDAFTHYYWIITPSGEYVVYETPDFTHTLTEVGVYDIFQEVMDEYWEDDWTMKQITVHPALSIKGKVEHTPEWLKIHQKLGNNPLDFYSGEAFVLNAEVSSQPIDYVKVKIKGELINGTLINDEVFLTRKSSTLYTGEYFKDAFANPKTFIKKSPPPLVFTFEVKYSNGVIKKDIVNVNVIGNIYSLLELGQKF
jgi:alpha-tubulin suppressor-like RCC1 family protein